MVKKKGKSKATKKLKKVLKSKPKTKKKPKTKSKAKVKSKTKSKLKTKTKSKAKTKIKTKVKTKTTNKKKKKSSLKMQLNDGQKGELLEIIKRILSLHKEGKMGLKSLDAIDRIVDQYNQQYTTATNKFDAIVKLGLEKDPALMKKAVYLSVKAQDENDLYQLLVLIGKGKIEFYDARQQLQDIHDQFYAQKHNRQFERTMM